MDYKSSLRPHARIPALRHLDRSAESGSPASLLAGETPHLRLDAALVESIRTARPVPFTP